MNKEVDLLSLCCCEKSPVGMRQICPDSQQFSGGETKKRMVCTALKPDNVYNVKSVLMFHHNKIA